MKAVEKKILPVYFAAAASMRKNFELRKDEDSLEPGDTVILREWSPENGYTGNQIERRISYVLRNAEEYGLKEGYCILALHPCDTEEPTEIEEDLPDQINWWDGFDIS